MLIGREKASGYKIFTITNIPDIEQFATINDQLLVKRTNVERSLYFNFLISILVQPLGIEQQYPATIVICGMCAMTVLYAVCSTDSNAISWAVLA